MKIGFIGVGNMGGNMAANLIRKTGELYVYDLSQAAVDVMVGKGASYMIPAHMAEKCEIIFMMLPNGNISKQTLFGENGIADNIGGLKIVVDMSSVTSAESKYCYDRLHEQGVGFVDSPVSGGMGKAIDGTLAFMVGGDEPDVEAVSPLLMAMGSSVIRVGGPGTGSVTKLANQVIVAALIGAMGEAYTLAAKAGADPAIVFEAIRGGLAQNTLMENYLPKVLERDFKPGGALKVFLKDVNNIVSCADELDAEVPISKLMKSIITSEELESNQMDDHRVIVQYFEKKTGVTLVSNK